ncbi:MAG: class I SAM-dependent methyltransferase [Planctomycetes bacterium]|nr:class I SAM-dependent methyltransferase [Planctomycetota bacterium]
MTVSALEHSLHVLATISNYNRWIFRAFEDSIGEDILEVGCGTGNITEFLLTRGRVTALDVDESFVGCARERFRDHPLLTALEGDILCPPAALEPDRFDTVVCLNVLEHIEDDEEALANMRDLLAPGGRAIILVPALRLLFGTIDAALGHVRRYARGELAGKLRRQGFEPRAVRFLNALGALGWFASGKILRRRFIPVRQARIFDRIVPVASAIERLLRPPFGQSLLAVAEKPARNA